MLSGRIMIEFLERSRYLRCLDSLMEFGTLLVHNSTKPNTRRRLKFEIVLLIQFICSVFLSEYLRGLLSCARNVRNLFASSKGVGISHGEFTSMLTHT
ncbi:unnamed protein product [Camellia sinensis]